MSNFLRSNIKFINYKLNIIRKISRRTSSTTSNVIKIITDIKFLIK